jgi:hypothetical protein
MSSVVFSLINCVDLVLASFLPLVLRVSFWGLLAGIAAMVIYAVASNQESISSLKREIKEHRKRMLDSSVEAYSEYAALAGKNLKASIALLGKVIGPALLSALPVLVIAGWLDAYHAYTLPEGTKTVALTFVPALSETVEISPPELVRIERGVLMIAPPEVHPVTVSFSANGKALYSGDPFIVPTPVIAKKGWLNLILPTGAGYVHPGSPVEEIHLDLPRKHLFKGLPSWASGWEFPYFFSVLVAALAIKLIFKIH